MADPLVVDVLSVAVTATGTEPLLDEDGATLVDDEGYTLVTDGEAVFFFRRPSTSMEIAVTADPVEFTLERRRVYITFGPLLRAPRRIYPGSTVLINGTFKDEDGIAFDPLEVKLLVSAPYSTRLSSYLYGDGDRIRRTASGRYEIDLTLDEPGRWVVQWRVVARDVVSIKEMSLLVQETPHYQYASRDYADG